MAHCSEHPSVKFAHQSSRPRHVQALGFRVLTVEFIRVVESKGSHNKNNADRDSYNSNDVNDYAH